MSALKDIADEECKMEMTPMIDVTFLLLIFFVCTIKFKTLEGKLAAYLPKDVGVSASEAEPKEKIDIVIKMEKPGYKVQANPYEKQNIEVKWNEGDGEFYLVGHEVSYKIIREVFDGDEAGLAKIRRNLADHHRADEERAVTLKPMQGIVYADIIPILDIVIDIGYTDVTFAGSYGK